MAFLSTLKEIASKVGKVIGIAGKAGAAIAPFLPPSIGGFLGVVANGVARAEIVAKRLSDLGIEVGGQGKGAIAEAFAAEGLDLAELVAGRDIGDNEKYRRGVESVAAGRRLIISGVADILDSVVESPQG